MKRFIQYSCLVAMIITLSNCAQVPQNQAYTKGKHVVAHPTYYNRHEDKYGNKIAIGGRAREGITVAMRRKVAQLGKEGWCPNFANIIGTGKIRVEDRGTAVEKLKATHGKQEVIDVYLECKNRKEFRRRVAYYEEKIGEFVDIYF